MATPLKKLTNHITNHEKFKGSSVTGTPKDDGFYDVYSYTKLIAVFRYQVMTYFDDTSYSNTTSTLQHLIRANYTIGSMDKLNKAKTHKKHKKDIDV